MRTDPSPPARRGTPRRRRAPVEARRCQSESQREAIRPGGRRGDAGCQMPDARRQTSDARELRLRTLWPLASGLWPPRPPPLLERVTPSAAGGGSARAAVLWPPRPRPMPERVTRSSAEVVIAGAGIAGVATAYFLAVRHGVDKV